MTKDKLPIYNPEDYEYSPDMGLVSALVCYGYELYAIDKTQGQKAMFILKKNDKIDELKRKYYNKKLKVDAETFFNAIKSVKNQLYSG
jgi:hypothetical protein